MCAVSSILANIAVQLMGIATCKRWQPVPPHWLMAAELSQARTAERYAGTAISSAISCSCSLWSKLIISCTFCSSGGPPAITFSSG
jgi:hypothetical protein